MASNARSVGVMNIASLGLMGKEENSGRSTQSRSARLTPAEAYRLEIVVVLKGSWLRDIIARMAASVLASSHLTVRQRVGQVFAVHANLPWTGPFASTSLVNFVTADLYSRAELELESDRISRDE